MDEEKSQGGKGENLRTFEPFRELWDKFFGATSARLVFKPRGAHIASGWVSGTRLRQRNSHCGGGAAPRRITNEGLQRLQNYIVIKF